jgi:hypothetical protein
MIGLLSMENDGGEDVESLIVVLKVGIYIFDNRLKNTFEEIRCFLRDKSM